MNIFSAYFSYMRSPLSALQSVLSSRRLGQGVAGYACAALCMVIYFNVGAGITPGVFAFKFFILFCAELILGYFVAALSGLFLDLSGAPARSGDVFVLVGYAGCIKGLLAATALITAAVPSMAFIGPFMWALTLVCQAAFVTKNFVRLYGVTLFRALGALAFGFLPLAAAGVLAGVFFVWGLVALF